MYGFYYLIIFFSAEAAPDVDDEFELLLEVEQDESSSTSDNCAGAEVGHDSARKPEMGPDGRTRVRLRKRTCAAYHEGWP